MDRQRVKLDGFAIEDPELGLTAFGSPHDPEPSLVVARDRQAGGRRPPGPAGPRAAPAPPARAGHGHDQAAGQAHRATRPTSPAGSTTRCCSRPTRPPRRRSGSVRSRPPSREEALELELGMRGLTSYAETVSLYGTEQVFTDGDGTPWSKAFLTSAYASRGMKMRVSSGAGAEVLMAGAQGKSMLYLEARCVALARAIGAQGVQNGGIDGASVAAAVPGGLRELMAENVMVMMRNLESCSGNGALMSESDMRRTSSTLPIVLAGSDFAFSGFGSIQRYDNMFGPSNFNAEDIDDFLAMQRDWGIDGGLRTVAPARLGELRREAAQACRAVYAHLGLADFTDEQVELAVDAGGAKDLGETDTLAGLGAAHAIRQRRLTVLDIVAALDECGYCHEAERAVAFVRTRLSGDYLQTSAIFD